MKKESLEMAKAAYLIEKECIEGLLEHFDESLLDLRQAG